MRASSRRGSGRTRPGTAPGPGPGPVTWLLVAIITGCGGAPDGTAAAAERAPADSPVAARHSAPSSTPQRAVALTYDDLPGVAVASAGCDLRALSDLNRRLLDGLRRNGVTAAGLVTGSRMCGDAPPDAGLVILREWVAAGHTLGNHTYSHRDYNDADPELFRRDIERNQALIDSAVPSPADRWFRAPFLHYGDTRAERDSLYAYLSENGYRIARVSMDSQEWVFADAYGTAKARGDSAVARRVGDAWVAYMDTVFAFYERETEALLGRYPPQVLLLHVNELNADYLDPLVAMIRRRGHAIVPMETALADPWYAESDGYVGPRGVSWLHRRAAALQVEVPEEPRDPAWLAALR